MEKDEEILILFCETAIAPEVKKELEELGSGYSYFAPVLGSGRTGKKENNPIFPGANTCFVAAVNSEEIAPLKRRLEAIRAGYRVRPGLSLFVLGGRRKM